MRDRGDIDERIDTVLDGPEAGGLAIRGGAIRIAGFAIASVFGLVSVPLLTRHLGPADFGDFAAVMAIAFVVGGFADAGLTNIGIREFSVRSASQRHRLLAGLLGMRLVVTTFAVALATAIVGLTGAAAPIVAGTLITGVALVLTHVQVTYLIPLASELSYGRTTALEVLRQGVSTVVIVALVAVGAALIPFFWAAVVAAVVTLVATLIVVGPSERLRPKFDVELFRSLAREAVPYTLALAGGFLYFRLAVILMSYLAPPDETGFYGAAFRIIEVVGVLPWLAVSAAFPILSRAAVNDGERMRYALRQLFGVSLVVGTGLSIALIAGAPVVVSVVAGPEFEPAVTPLRLLAVAQLTSFIVATGVYALLALRRYRQIMVATLAATGITAVGTVGLEPVFGASGAALATAAAEGALAFLYVLALFRIDRAFFPSARYLPRFLVVAGLSTAIAYVLRDHALIAAVAATAVYFGCALAAGLIPDPLLAAIRSPMRALRNP